MICFHLAEDVPPELFSFIKWVCTGSEREISQLGEHRRCSLEKEITSCISNIMYITKSDQQINHTSDQDFRTLTINENKMVIKTTLQIRHCSRSKKIVNALHANGVTMSNNHALQIETALANSVINCLHITPSGIDLFPFLQKDKFIYFHFNNTDFSIDTSDGKGQLHGGLIVVFQNGNDEFPQQQLKFPSIDYTATTYRVNKISLTEIINCEAPNLKTFKIEEKFLYNSLPEQTPLENTKHMLPWLILKTTNPLETSPWSGYFSEIEDAPCMKTNIAALPIIPYPVTEWSTIFTALTIMDNISKDIMGANHLTTISLDLAIHEKAVQLAYSNNRLAAMYNFRLGELHISMAHLRGIGTYIENSGLDSIWIESNTYGPAVVRSIKSCTHKMFQCYFYQFLWFSMLYQPP